MRRPPQLSRRLIGTGLLAAAECATQFVFGVLLGTAVVTAVYATPAGVERSAVWAISILGSGVAIFFMNRAVSVVRGRRPGWRRRNPSKDSQAHNPSISALNRRFRRG